MKNQNFSIGVPAYNQGQYLRQTLMSLLSQHIKPLEIVVSDNHSTDETAKVLQDFEGRVKIIRPDSHLPVEQHLNFLVSALQGEWVSIISSDDIAKPTFVSALVAGTQRTKNAVLVKGGWEYIDGEGKFIGRNYLHHLSKTVVSPPATLYEQLTEPRTCFGAFAMKKQVWEQVGGFPETCKHSIDWIMWLRLSPYGDFIRCKETIFQYRANYRPGLQNLRIRDKLQDEVTVVSNVIPEAAAALGIHDPKRFTDSSRHLFRDSIADASRLLDPCERTEIADLLEPWAIAVGCEHELYRFRKGEVLSSRGVTRFRELVRCVLRSII